MSLSHALRKSIGRLLIGVLLFAQFAVAGYACPGLQGFGSGANSNAVKAMPVEAAGAAGTDESSAMPPGCDQMDPASPNLCAEHCHQGQQRADTAAFPEVGLGILTLLYSIPLEPQHSLGSGRSSPVPDAHLDAAPEPPHAILHCVFRI